MNWKVRIRLDPFTGACHIFIYRLRNGVREYLQPGPDGNWLVNHADEHHTSSTPTLTFPEEDQRDILSDFAAQLAQMGYGALDATPAARAMERHIESLEKQADRLFRLADKTGAPA